MLAKKDVAVQWCQNASEYMLNHGGKPWKYILIPHDAITEKMTLKGLSDRYTITTKCSKQIGLGVGYSRKQYLTFILFDQVVLLYIKLE